MLRNAHAKACACAEAPEVLHDVSGSTSATEDDSWGDMCLWIDNSIVYGSWESAGAGSEHADGAAPVEKLLGVLDLQLRAA